MSGILDGIRVVDMSRYISGPYCAMMLADMGAEVIKVEKPGEGEIYRVGGPWKDGVSLVFQAMNRNKKSVTADTRSPEGLQLIKELILHSDVLIENFRAGVMEKMGLGYEELHKLNPRLIMVSITGFGHSGPLRDRMAFDGIISAMSGVTRIDGDKVERSKGAIHDHMAGMNAVIGTLLALLDREKTGKGQYVDTAMIACSTVLRSDSIADAYLNGDEAAMGSDDAAPYGYLKTKDDWVNFQAGTNQLFRKLRTICPEPVVQEERWLDDLPYRVTHHAELFAAIQKWASNMTADELEKKFVDAGIPAGIVATPGPSVAQRALVGKRLSCKNAGPRDRRPGSLYGFSGQALCTSGHRVQGGAGARWRQRGYLRARSRQEQRRARRAEKEKRNLKTER